LPVTSHDTLCPSAGAELRTEEGRGHTDADEIAQLNADQIGRSWSLPLPEHAAGRVPSVGRKQWLRTVPGLVDTAAGRAAAARRGTGLATVLLCAPVIAKFAEGVNGRRITASVATMARKAGCSEERMRRARYVLGDLGLAQEMVRGRPLGRVEQAAATAHHGGRQTRAASVWHLTLPRGLSSPQACGYLSSRTSVLEVCSVGDGSPKRARAHARPGKSSHTRQSRDEPRPLHLQRAAAGLVAACQGMDVGQWASVGFRRYVRLPGWHIGQICDLLVEAGIDTTVWTGRTIAQRLTAYTVERKLTWPNNLREPVGFLRSLLTRIDWSTPPVRSCRTTVAQAPASRAAGPDSAARRAAVAVAAAADARGAERRRERSRAARPGGTPREWRATVSEKSVHGNPDDRLDVTPSHTRRAVPSGRRK
jgi:hypothetical protein